MGTGQSESRATPHARAVSAGVLAGLVVGALLFSALAWSQADFDPEALGLGANTVTRRPAPIDGHVVSGGMGTVPALARAAKAFRADGFSTALWLGASQLHGLNAPKPDDDVAADYAQQAADARGAKLRYLQMSSPNATYYDLLAAYVVARALGMQPDALVVAVTYDDFRETATRHYDNRDTLEAVDWPALEEVAGAGIAELRTQVEELAKRDANKEPGTPQDRLENALVEVLEQLWSPYAARGQLRSQSRVLYRSALTSLLGGSFERVGGKVPPETEAWSEKALNSLIALARHDGVEVVLYQPPHRPDQPKFYYVREDYDRRFAGLAKRAEAGEFHFASFEGLVPERYWGVTNEGRPDCFHFEVEGHRRLGRALDAWLAAHGVPAPSAGSKPSTPSKPSEQGGR